MKKINAKFIAGMLAMALVFGMSGCDTGTNTVTETKYVNTGTQGGNEPADHPFTAKSATQLDNLLHTVANGTIYVVGNYEANGDITLNAGQSLVIADQGLANSQPWPNASVGQFSLGDVNAVSRLTIPQNHTLTVQSGAKLIVGNPNTPSQNNGVLKIQGGAGLTVEGGAILGVTTASRVLVEKLEDNDSGGLDIRANAEVFGFGALGSLELIGNVATDAAADALIAVEKLPSGVSAPAVVSGAKFYINGENVTNDITTKIEEIANASPVKEVNSADNIEDLFKGDAAEGVAPATKVTYTGDTAIGEVSIPEGATLVIAGTIAEQEDAITVTAGGTLVIAEGAALAVANEGTLTVEGSLTTSGTLTVGEGAELTIEDGAALVVEDKGTLDLSALFTGEDGDTTVALEGELVVADGGTLKLSTGDGTGVIPEINWDAGGSLKIESGGGLTLATPGETPDVPYIAASGTENALYTWDEEDTNGSITLAQDEMILDGKITAANPGGSIGESITATVTPNSEFTVGPWAGAWYAIEGTLVVEKNAKVTVKTHIYTYGTLIVEEGATLDLAATSALLSGVVFVMDTGELQVSGTVKAEATSGENTYVGWIELTDESSKLTLLPGGKLDISAGSSIYTDSSGSGTSAPRVSVYAVTGDVVGTVAQVVTDEDSGNTAWKLKAGGPDGTVVAAISDITLGKLKFSTEANKAVDEVTGTSAGGSAAAGTLTAGDGTAIVFLGASGG
jgi:hypothetical protein